MARFWSLVILLFLTAALFRYQSQALWWLSRRVPLPATPCYRLLAECERSAATRECLRSFQQTRCGENLRVQHVLSSLLYQEGLLAEAQRAAKLAAQIDDDEAIRFHAAVLSFDVLALDDAVRFACASEQPKAKELCRLAVLLQDLEPDMERRSEPPFLVQFHRQLPAARHAVVEVLHRALRRVEPYFAMPPATRIGVTVLPDKLFEDLLQVSPEIEAQALNAHLFLRHPYYAPRSRTYEATVAHELVHALIYLHVRKPVATWLNEGLAQVLSREEEPYGPQARTLRRKVRDSGLRLSDLETKWEEGIYAPAAYYLSRQAVLRLMETASWEAIRDLLPDCAEGCEAVIRERFGLDYPALEAAARG